MPRTQIIYLGRVQGVGFRATVAGAARHFAVTGWVRNEPDGSVRLVAEGEADEIERFLAEVALRLGMFIRATDRHDESPCGEVGFEIRR